MIGMTEFMHFYSAVAISIAAVAAADKLSKTFESCSNHDAMCASNNNRSDKMHKHKRTPHEQRFVHLGFVIVSTQEKQNMYKH